MIRRKSRWLVLLLIAILGTSCTELQTYNSATLGISIAYPSDWEVDDHASDQVTFSSPGRSSTTSVSIILDDSDINSDPIATLEKISAASVNNNSLQSVEQPELVQIRDYQAARMQAVSRLSIGVYLGEKGELRGQGGTDISITPQVEYDVPVEILSIVNGDKAVIIFIIGPNREARKIAESLRFTN